MFNDVREHDSMGMVGSWYNDKKEDSGDDSNVERERKWCRYEVVSSILDLLVEWMWPVLFLVFLSKLWN
jgi:hypothetical protein